MPETSVAEAFVFGAISSAASKTVAAPVERIKLILQLQAEAPLITKRYNGITDCLSRVPKEQGWLSFWRGNLPNVIRFVPTQAFNFALDNFYHRVFAPLVQPWIGDPQADFGSGYAMRHLFVNFTFSAAAAATGVFVIYPLDFARTRLALDVGKGSQREFTGTMDCILKTARARGWGKGGVCNGFVITCLGVALYRGAYFGSYQTAFDLGLFRRDAGSVEKFMLAYAITVVAGMISYPLDTIRRRMMMTSGALDVDYASARDCFAKILRREGFGAFYRGAGVNIVRGLCSAFVLVGFDFLQANSAPHGN